MTPRPSISGTTPASVTRARSLRLNQAVLAKTQPVRKLGDRTHGLTTVSAHPRFPSSTDIPPVSQRDCPQPPRFLGPTSSRARDRLLFRLQSFPVRAHPRDGDPSFQCRGLVHLRCPS